MTTPELVTDLATFRERAAGADPGDRVPVEARVTVADPFEAYRRARQVSGGCFLETSGGTDGWSYFGVEPFEWLTVDPGSDTIGTLVDRLDEEHLHRRGTDVPYPCGTIGWLSYDVAREIEDLPGSAERDRDLPRLQVAFYDTLAAWQEPAESPVTLRVTACPRVESDPDAAFERGRERALDLARRAVDGDIDVQDPPSAGTVRFESDTGRNAFTDRVDRVREYIHEGDTFQANISHRLTAPAAVHPVDAFESLRAGNPAPYSALLEFPAADLVSASPELLLHREGDRLVTEPIAGTRPRGETPAEDRDLEADLRADEKERAEHAMLVDLERNDLGKVSEFGSVDVREYRRVDRYSEVMHLVSLVEGQLRDDRDLADAIRAVFPGGTITGAPKPRTMAIIDELEATRRGPYTGSIGIFGFDDRATLNIVIRTLVRQSEAYHLRVGAGIVHDSVPDREYDETLDKARALVTAVGDALDRDLSVDGVRPTDRGDPTPEGSE
ncbi:Anthranilate synthase component 1 2 protein [Halorhabdus tiamatea SARL4B]|uniref:anthranilate synthase n=1 Tax=Halorhabdus tiamatea SARL4B TaxID=1033806 RepID=F7PFH2_9EURY|nr:aminodeoxychorismate synthase, component I [Halorhabdus tiamatea]ERJ06468.1 Anthranilate synthase component 1 2 protein [Halorhabdus tiamatea SARL4B]CCQ34367.1 para-aminobenzoate synthase, component I [Halorhabdus tiamatea SARL4B]